jgi:hypothetical protein
MNNYYKPGPNSDTGSVAFVKSSYARDGATSWGPAKWYINGNVAEGFAKATEDNWTAVEVETYKLADIRVDERIVTQTPWYRYTVNPVGSYVPEQYMLYNIEDAEDAYKTVVDHAGTINRDVVERRIADETANGTTHYQGSKAAGIIDTESEAEGFFEYDTNYTVPTDTDGDGMPDEWEKAHNLNPNLSDNNSLNADGYTALEVYLNSLMGEEMDTNFGETGVAKNIVRAQASYDSTSHVLTVSSDAVGARLDVFTTDGRLISAQRIAQEQTSLANMPSGILLLRISGTKIAPVVLKATR